MIDEGIVHAVDVTGRVGQDALGDLTGLAGVLAVQAHGNLELKGVGHFGPLLHVAAVDDILAGDNHLGVVAENGDVLVQLFHEEIVQVFHLVISRRQRAAVTVLGSFGVLDIAVDIDGVDGTVDGQDTAHGGVGLGIRALIGLDELHDIVAVVEHGDISSLPVYTGGHAVGGLTESARCTHLGPLGIQRLVVEPESVVVGLKEGHGTGSQVGRLRNGHSSRVLVELGKLVPAGGETYNREQRQCNEYFICFHGNCRFKIRI